MIPVIRNLVTVKGVSKSRNGVDVLATHADEGIRNFLPYRISPVDPWLRKIQSYSIIEFEGLSVDRIESSRSYDQFDSIEISGNWSGNLFGSMDKSLIAWWKRQCIRNRIHRSPEYSQVLWCIQVVAPLHRDFTEAGRPDNRSAMDNRSTVPIIANAHILRFILPCNKKHTKVSDSQYIEQIESRVRSVQLDIYRSSIRFYSIVARWISHITFSVENKNSTSSGRGICILWV